MIARRFFRGVICAFVFVNWTSHGVVCGFSFVVLMSVLVPLLPQWKKKSRSLLSLSIPKPKLSLSSSKDSRGDIMIHEMMCFYYYTIVVYIYFT